MDAGERTESRSLWRRLGEDLWLWARTLASAAVYATLIVTFGAQVARVEGRSMEPTLEDSDRLVVDKLAYRLHDPGVGDVVMLLSPTEPEKALVKRVIAGPGDRVALRSGRVYQNGDPVDESYLSFADRAIGDRRAEVVPAGHYFVLGDNRDNSSDSRDFGPVPRMYILGKIRVRWWPLDRVRLFAP